ncbi:MAG: hypothetical protein DRG33_00340 [Deltaproteobacteria bacterium]|nr:MAG: hypothetical protein DRG33_00340 [Deltaproteobacteria bacterium]
MISETEGWTLYEALQHLYDEGLSGRLHIYHWDDQEGVIGLNNGLIVHCHVRDLRGMEALEVIRNWVTISMNFFENVENITVNIEEDTESILASLEEQDREIKLFRQLIPNADAVFELSPEGPDSNISLTPRTWKFLALVNGRNTIKDICRALGASEFSVMKALYLLAKGRIIRLVALEEILPATVRERFLKEMEEAMAQYIGPIASIVIDDTFREMGKNPEHITKNDLPLIVERVSENIDDEGDRVKFQSQMLSFIQRILKEEGA